MPHQHSDIDLKQLDEEASASTASLSKIAQLYKQAIVDLEKQRSESELALEEAEARFRKAEKRAQEADENYRKAIDLKRGQYEQLIHDLFETPKNNLEQSIKRQSRRTNRLTMIVAILSIVISLAITVWSVSNSSNSTSAVLSKTDDLLSKMDKTTDNLVSRIDQTTGTVIDNIYRNNPRVVNIMERIVDEKKNFRDFATKNDLALAYKMRLGSSFSSIKYEEYVQAFKYAGVDMKMISDANELRRWDTEYLELCKNALKKIQAMKPDDKIEDQDRRIGTFKSYSDSTDYDGWGQHKEDMKYADLISFYQNELSKFQKRLDLNKK